MNYKEMMESPWHKQWIEEWQKTLFANIFDSCESLKRLKERFRLDAQDKKD